MSAQLPPRNSLSRVVITGGAGFLGSHVVLELLALGAHVVVLDDFSNGKRQHLADVADHPNLEVIEGSITDRAAVHRSMRGATTVIHLAVLGLRQSIKEPTLVNRVIVDGTLHCLEAASLHGVELFVNCSSSEVYGTALSIRMTEDHPLNPETPYAAAKVAQDMYVGSWGRTYGLPWTTIRPFNMYGPNSHWQGRRGELIPKMIVRALNHKPLIIFGDGLQTRDFVYVEDAAVAVVTVAAELGCRGEILNLATGSEVSVRRVAEAICERVGLQPDEFIEYQDPRPGDVRRHAGDASRLASLTGFRTSTSFEDGLDKTVEWFRSSPMAPAAMLAGEQPRAWE